MNSLIPPSFCIISRVSLGRFLAGSNGTLVQFLYVLPNSLPGGLLHFAFPTAQCENVCFLTAWTREYFVKFWVLAILISKK